MGRVALRAALLLAPCFGAYAQDPAANAAKTFPVRPVRVVVPFPPAGTNDILGRFVAAKLTERLGRQFVVENRPGADGIIGAELVAKVAKAAGIKAQ